MNPLLQKLLGLDNEAEAADPNKAAALLKVMNTQKPQASPTKMVKKAVVAPKGGPLDKKAGTKSKSAPIAAAPQPPRDVQQIVSEGLQGNIDPRRLKAEEQVKQWQAVTPSETASAMAGARLQDMEFNPEGDFNTGMFKNALAEQLMQMKQQRENPMQGIDVEGLDRFIANATGRKAIGLKNVAQPDAEALAKITHLKTAGDNDRAKMQFGAVASQIKPAGQIVYGVAPQTPQQPKGPGQPKEVRGTEIQKFLEKPEAYKKMIGLADTARALVNKLKALPATDVSEISKTFGELARTNARMKEHYRTVSGSGAAFSESEQAMFDAQNPASAFGVANSGIGALGAMFKKGANAKLGDVYDLDAYNRIYDRMSREGQAEVDAAYNNAGSAFKRPGEAEYLATRRQGLENVSRVSGTQKPQRDQKADNLLNKIRGIKGGK